MERKRVRRIVVALVLALGGVLLVGATLRSQAKPLGRHCIGAGPLPLGDDDFCGCTWGQVLFRGQPMAGAAVTLSFGGDVTATVTRRDAEEPVTPYFDVTGHPLGAQRGDVMTLTARFAGQTVSRTFRAWPDTDGEQHLVLAFAERGVWQPWVTGGYTRALALDEDVAWAGGPAGLISIGLTSGVSVVHTLPWPDPFVRALAVGTDGHIWAAGDGGVAELVPSSIEGFDGASWQTHTVPLAGTPRVLAVDAASGAVWLGGGDSAGGAVVYTGGWGTVETFSAPVTALVVDDAGRAWAATYGDGVYRQDGSGGWTHYWSVDGLASDKVLAAAAGDGAVWFGTEPYLSGGGSRGGISRYDLATGTWKVYTTAHGLPADDVFTESPASIYALTVGESHVWAGTVDGLRFLAGEDWWAAHTSAHGLRPGAVWAVADGAGTVIAAPLAGLDRLDAEATPGSPPTAQITSVISPTLTLGQVLTLNGSGVDGDEGGASVVAWDWSSDLDGPLCTQAVCELPHALFTWGAHSISLRVQDDEGDWSAAVTAGVEVERVWWVYLPLVARP